MKEKMLFYIFVGVLAAAFFGSLLIPEPYVQRMVEAERRDNYSFMGLESAQSAENRATQWYEALFVKTHITQFTFDLTADAKPLGDEKYAAIDKASEAGISWWEGRMRVLWLSAYQFLVRLSMALVWIPLALLVVLPFVVDSLVARQVKATNFAVTSPHLQIIGSKSIFWMALMYIILQMLPMKLHPAWTPSMIALFSAAVWLAISQFAKRG